MASTALLVSAWLAVASGLTLRKEPKQCLPEGGILYLHIMKNYGSSVENYLRCAGERTGFGMKIHDDPLISLMKGDPACADTPFLCSIHQGFADRVDLCGPPFEKPAKVMTVLREPVDRAFSFYQYNIMMGDEMAIATPLADMLRSCKNQTGDEQRIQYFCRHLSNHMTQHIFAAEGSVNEARYPSSESELAFAKETFTKVDAVFFTDDFDDFLDMFHKSQLLQEDGGCEILHANPTACSLCADEMNEEERMLLVELNQQDMQLYAWALTQPNRYAP